MDFEDKDIHNMLKKENKVQQSMGQIASMLKKLYNSFDAQGFDEQESFQLTYTFWENWSEKIVENMKKSSRKQSNKELAKFFKKVFDDKEGKNGGNKE